jgi:hypothetical protein
MNPYDVYVGPWTGWDESGEQSHHESGNPILDKLWESIHEELHDPLKDYFCGGLVDEAVRQGMIDPATGKAILPVLELVFDKIDPCH